MPNTYYVQAQVDTPTGQIAVANYYIDKKCSQPATLPLSVALSAGACTIIQATDSTLTLVGAVFKTIGGVPVLTSNNFYPASQGSVSISMPTDDMVTKGVVLLFSDPLQVSALYPTSDPQITNET
ncbi:hypothetical protein [Roseateles toxinivorans]|uniref:Uncharacterized protein n=1 Tax=Roseateles toxinivorans TaxID=270368 RepID=A0A4V3CTK7_9BURK|nr:hypothetical protein [Roseateles toxinivorans]TDP72684.1 hypothetical protein DES47_102429 [Roseateles toxinivorans]